ncbi:MAG: M23 family metallopeptidase [Chloroflexaceae bacterium]|jgi:murein DD-endopeptidase MepM/ murein hydrolase activator NlpD|nr:M23 family metallopeptidase [Chloroflexaceae bacterium]
MMYGDGWPYLTRERAILLIVALVCLGFLLFQTREPNQQLISTWRGDSFAVYTTQAGLKAEAVPEQAGQGLGDTSRPTGNPLGNARTVMTQGYGVGTHAPANVWGAIDLAVAPDGSNQASPGSTTGTPIYATHGGVVNVTPNSYPAGNHVWVVNDEYRTGYSHLQDFAVQDGQTVQRGELIGYVGSSGMSSGPHLDYQIWQKQGGRWVNLNPLDFDVLQR